MNAIKTLNWMVCQEEFVLKTEHGVTRLQFANKLLALSQMLLIILLWTLALKQLGRLLNLHAPKEDIWWEILPELALQMEIGQERILFVNVSNFI